VTVVTVVTVDLEYPRRATELLTMKLQIQLRVEAERQHLPHHFGEYVFSDEQCWGYPSTSR